jgi:hypothetical protein
MTPIRPLILTDPNGDFVVLLEGAPMPSNMRNFWGDAEIDALHRQLCSAPVNITKGTIAFGEVHVGAADYGTKSSQWMHNVISDRITF